MTLGSVGVAVTSTNGFSEIIRVIAVDFAHALFSASDIGASGAEIAISIAAGQRLGVPRRTRNASGDVGQRAVGTNVALVAGVALFAATRARLQVALGRARFAAFASTAPERREGPKTRPTAIAIEAGDALGARANARLTLRLLLATEMRLDDRQFAKTPALLTAAILELHVAKVEVDFSI